MTNQTAELKKLELDKNLDDFVMFGSGCVLMAVDGSVKHVTLEQAFAKFGVNKIAAAK